MVIAPASFLVERCLIERGAEVVDLTEEEQRSTEFCGDMIKENIIPLHGKVVCYKDKDGKFYRLFHPKRILM